MKMNRCCHVCILQQILRTAAHMDLGEEQQEEAYRRVLAAIAGLDHRDFTSPEFAAAAYGELSTLAGDPDPYLTVKREQNRMILDRLDFFNRRIAAAADPLETAARYALMGNIIDLGAERLFDTDSVFADPGGLKIRPDDFRRFRRGLDNARRLLVIGDNAGEAVLDGLFLREARREFPHLATGYAVRSAPAINDVTAADARHAGLEEVAEIIPSGSRCAGTLLSRATARFREWFDAPDTAVISKGQGNFETLEDAPRTMLFMFRVKCDVVARYIGLPLDTPVMAFRESFPGVGSGFCHAGRWMV